MSTNEVKNLTSFFEFDLKANNRIFYFLAGKTFMTALLSENLESVEFIEINEAIIRCQKSIDGLFATACINNAADFPDFSKFQPTQMRTKVEKSFLIIAAGIWAQSILLYNEENEIKNVHFEQAQTKAIESNINKLLALRSVLSKLQMTDTNLEPEILEESFLDYESFLYRQSFAVTSQSSVWQAIVEIAEQLKINRILDKEKIYQICEKQKEFPELKRKITQFYSRG